ncbi:TetR/AcrR family transcriptional regulator [Streptomonospora nanhaiensis]|uniref:AcrR family transcriptional regulator n=1 Tax=Streptomonospora nanhaiensis TaxID=1323731 RepID=A0A853BME6_9ACTN|nr:TetR family transcriptional regulator [Streptomonospora nanhaiensis]MBV2365141.1 TetR family transcriptional regulator [Streptomonospora nanhaiensis]MBX9387772.1 TetR family transcriptional regulator [Streptomonospora nanhaiensis]NYI96648.1 AcrR family transcriptional regulator [Streptomonospora nanhaiensis]
MDVPPTADADTCAGRVRDREATRRRILASAYELFTSEGYEQVSSRRIAAHAGVNVALINRYFGAKRGLLAEVIAEDAAFPGVFEGDPATLPRRIAEHVTRRTLGEGTPLQRALVHSMGDPDLQSVYQERLQNAIIDPLAACIGGESAHARAALVASLLLGVNAVRRMGGAGPLTDEDPEVLTARLTRVVEACIADD